MQKIKVKSLLLNLSLLAFALFFILAIFEIGLRIFHPVDLAHHIHHPTLDHFGIPNDSYLLTNPNPFIREYLIPLERNSLGFIDSEHNMSKSNNTYRILVLGDSFMECGSVSADKCYFKILEEYLDNNCKTSKDFEVINMGIGSYSIDSEYVLYDELGKNFSPDLVLVAFFIGNDLDMKVAELKEGKVTFKSFEKARFYVIRSFFGRHSHAYNFVGRTLILLKRGSKADIYGFAEDQDYEGRLELYEKVFDLFRNQIRGDRRKLAVLMVPVKEEIDEVKNTFYEEKIGIPLQHPELRNLLTEHLNKSSDLFIDPLQQMRSINKNNDFYYDIDGHWNDAGHEASAELSGKSICNFILRNKK